MNDPTARMSRPADDISKELLSAIDSLSFDQLVLLVAGESNWYADDGWFPCPRCEGDARRIMACCSARGNAVRWSCVSCSANGNRMTMERLLLASVDSVQTAVELIDAISDLVAARS